MCGIAGYINKNGYISDCDRLEAMTRAVAHRGPDDEGILIEGRVGLGHRRLSILDLSVDGHQPMSRRGTGLSIVFNGEIYNYLELRDELLNCGQHFVTATDTEVILAAYSEWGDQCVNHFNGMWSFAILDRPRNIIFCSRDRFGVKPFYYSETTDAWMFGSEIRQFLPLINGVRANMNVVREFLFAGVTEPFSDTFFEGVNKLPGGHNLFFDLATNSFTINRYYELKVNSALENTSLEEAINLYGNELSSAVSLRLRADVPVGTCLSGGLDSSSIATLAAESYTKARGEPFRAITAVSELKENDESSFASLVVANSGMEWIIVKPTYDDFAKNIDEVVRAQEEPFGGPSICMQFFVMKAARTYGIPVLLDGQAGDETLLGYERYYAGYFLNLAKTNGVIFAIKALRDCWKNNANMSPVKMLMFLLYFSCARFRHWNYCYRSRYFLKNPPLPGSIKMDAKAVFNIQHLQIREIETHLPQLLRFEDKNSMWHSIETRLPFLDYRAVETAISLPADSKIKYGWTKYLLRRFMEKKLPKSIIWRKNKIGFEAPDKLWLSRHASIMLEAVLSSKLLGKVCKPGYLKKSFQKLNHETRWRLYEVALWEKEFSVKS